METVIDHLFQEEQLGLHPDIAGIVPEIRSSIICDGNRFLSLDKDGKPKKMYQQDIDKIARQMKDPKWLLPLSHARLLGPPKFPEPGEFFKIYRIKFADAMAVKKYFNDRKIYFKEKLESLDLKKQMELEGMDFGLKKRKI